MHLRSNYAYLVDFSLLKRLLIGNLSKPENNDKVCSADIGNRNKRIAPLVYKDPASDVIRLTAAYEAAEPLQPRASEDAGSFMLTIVPSSTTVACLPTRNPVVYLSLLQQR